MTSTPPVLRWPLPAWVIAEAGVACPLCGTTARLVLGDRSDEPSHMSCPKGHAWAEARLTRRVGAELLAEVLDLDPSLLSHLEALQHEYGSSP